MTVLESTALLAWLNAEPGSAEVQEALDQGPVYLCDMTLAFLFGPPVTEGLNVDALMADLLTVGFRLMPLTSDQLAMIERLAPENVEPEMAMVLALARSLDLRVLTCDPQFAFEASVLDMDDVTVQLI